MQCIHVLTKSYDPWTIKINILCSYTHCKAKYIGWYVQMNPLYTESLLEYCVAHIWWLCILMVAKFAPLWMPVCHESYSQGIFVQMEIKISLMDWTFWQVSCSFFIHQHKNIGVSLWEVIFSMYCEYLFYSVMENEVDRLKLLYFIMGCVIFLWLYFSHAQNFVIIRNITVDGNVVIIGT